VKDVVIYGHREKRNNPKYVQNVKVLTGIPLEEYGERKKTLILRRKGSLGDVWRIFFRASVWKDFRMS
jgi:hypothetical protein